MDKAEFDKRFLAMVAQSNVPITGANVAYHLDIPIEEAQEHLLSLELSGTLSQQVDKEGDSVYVMPNRPQGGSMAVMATQSGDQQPPKVQNPANVAAAPVFHASRPQGPGVSGAAKSNSVNGLVLNAIVPGLGSLICGKMIGLAMMGLVLLGLILLFVLPGFSKLTAVLPVAIAWVWSLIAGIALLNEKESPHGVS